MAEDAKVPTGTRYDALRMLGVEPWGKRGMQLAKYLAKESHADLQMGGVSGLADVNAPEATAALIAALPGLTEHNRGLALDALLRDVGRTNALLDAIEKQHVEPAVLGEDRRKALRSHADESVRRRATSLLEDASS